MGHYNIILFKTKHKYENLSWAEMASKDMQDERAAYLKDVKKLLKTLNAADSDSYLGVYDNGVRKLFGYSVAPEDVFTGLNVTLNGKKYSFDILDVPQLTDVLYESVKNIGLTNIHVFEDIPFIHKFLEPFAKDTVSWFTDEAVESGLAACNDVITDKTKAEELLPSPDNTYDEAYFKGVKEFRKVLKHVQVLMRKKYDVYAISVLLKKN